MSHDEALHQDGRNRLAVSVVVPAKNESGNVAPLVAEIAAALQDRAFEVVYVNDGSSDATEQELRALNSWSQSMAMGRTIRHLFPH